LARFFVYEKLMHEPIEQGTMPHFLRRPPLAIYPEMVRYR